MEYALMAVLDYSVPIELWWGFAARRDAGPFETHASDTRSKYLSFFSVA
jgi:hypothetical protein